MNPNLFTVYSPGLVAQYETLQAAVTACPSGGLVKAPVGVWTMERLTIPRTMRIEGAYAELLSRPTFGSSAWNSANGYGKAVGTVLAFTCTDGNAIDFTGPNEGGLFASVSFRNLCIVGSGGTATGLALGSLTNSKSAIRLDQVHVGNFEIGVDIHTIFSGSVRDCIVSGCETGVKLNGNTLVIDNPDIRACTTGILLGGSGSTRIEGGAIQSCDYGVDTDEANEDSINGTYFEGNTTAAIRISSDSNHNIIHHCHFGTETDALIIDGGDNKVFIAARSDAPITINGSNNIVYDGAYGTPNLTLGAFGNYRLFINPYNYGGQSRFHFEIEAENATRNGVRLHNQALLLEDGDTLSKLTAGGIVPL